MSAAVEELRRLRGGDDLISNRSAGCSTTHAVLIVAGSPKPSRLTLKPGDCVLWGNTGRADMFVYSSRRRPSGSGNRLRGALFFLGFDVLARSAGPSIGPFKRLTPAEGREQLTAATLRAQRKAAPDRIPWAYVTPGPPVKISYVIDQTAAKGSFLLQPGPNAPRRHSSEFEQIRRLRGGESVLDERPAACAKNTHAVMIIAGRPHPRQLRVKPGACVVWGNTSDGYVDVASSRGCDFSGPCELFSINIPPRRAAIAFGPLKPGLQDLHYSVRPATGEPPPDPEDLQGGGEKGTIIVE